MNTLPREAAKQLLESLGGTVQSSVTKQTDLLIVGLDPGDAKLAAAKAKGIPFMPWEMFVTLGFAETYPRMSSPSSTPSQDILADLALHMGVTCNAIFSRLITTGDPRYRRAFVLGCGALSLILYGTWGDPTGRVPIHVQDHPIDLQDPGTYLGLAAVGWGLAHDLLKSCSLSEQQGRER